VREVIGRRLDRLSERCNEVLTIAAVIGRQFRFGVLMKLVGGSSGGEETTARHPEALEGRAGRGGDSGGPMSESMLLDAMDEALSARIIEEIPSEVGLYQFTHAQMQETLLSELPLTRRVRMHARIAEALEDYYGEAAETHAAELVEHFAEAETVLGPERFVRFGIVAGEKSLQAYAYDDALRYFELVRGAAEGLSDNGTKARFCYGYAQPLVVEASLEARQRGWDLLGEAFRLFRAAGNNRMAIAAAQTPVTFGALKGTVELTGAALELAEPDSTDAGFLHARHAIALLNEAGDLDSELVHLEKALSIARKHQDSRLEARTLIHYAQHYAYVGDAAKTVEYCDRAAALASRFDDPVTETRAIGWSMMAHLYLWQVEEFKRKLPRAREIADRYKQDIYVFGFRRREWALATAQGDWDLARQAAEAEESRRPGNPWTPIWLKVVSLQTGDADPESLDGTARGNIWEAGSALHSAMTWMTWRAHPRVGELVGDALRQSSERRFGYDLMHAMLSAILALFRDDSKLREQAIAALLRWSDQFDPGTGIPVDHVMGLAYSAEGDAASAERHLGRAAARCREAGFRPLLAYVLADSAELLLSSSEPGIQPTAAEFQDEAIAIARKLGMKPLMERVLAKREILKA
jgi:tetratricopeptide (TPR) repeat protein